VIRIHDNLYLDADDNCFMIVEWGGKIDRRGDLVRPKRKYYSDLVTLMSGLVKILARRAVRASTDLDELNSRLSDIARMIYDIRARVEACIGNPSERLRKTVQSSM
jgi:hypothetical protein